VQENKVFRQAVLDRLASPEQLHTLMRVTDAKGWLALLGCALLVATGVVWAIVGRIPTKVSASGILIHSGGLADVVALGAGQITALDVEVGDTVTKGQAIAQVAQPQLKEEIAAAKARLAELQANYQKTKSAGGRDVSLRMMASSQATQNLELAIQANEARTKELEDRLQKQTDLQAKGLVTGDAVEATREALRSARVSMQTMRADQQRLTVDDFSAQRQNEAALTAEAMSVQEAERQIKLLEERLEQNSRVVSTHEGRVVEVRSMTGDLIQPGTPIVSLERRGDKAKLEALLYVDSREGKILSPGMEVQIAPTIVKKERYGVMLGTVRTVEGFPSTRQGMMRVLKNEELVQSFLQETAGSPIAVRAELRRESSTPSGYHWSSGVGPDLVLTSGTRCEANVTTRTQRPLALILPALDFGR
jgi:HlyD family secretion protein